MSINGIKYYLNNKSHFFDLLSKKGFLNWMSDKQYLKIAFKLKIGRKLDLENPKSFNEKIQWIKLNDRKEEYKKYVDKYEVKKYIGELIGAKYIIPTLGIYNNFDDIDFDLLPNKFVIKCTHDSGGVEICTDKNMYDKEKARKKITKALKRDFYYHGREWSYKGIKPRILIEQYIENNAVGDLYDFKFFCFNGEIKFYKIDFDRFVGHHANYYDGKTDELLEFGEVYCPPLFAKKITLPDNLAEMKNIAQKLSKNMRFIRVDLYSTNNRIFFGELTLYPNSGFGKFIPEKYDEIIGEYLYL